MTLWLRQARRREELPCQLPPNSSAGPASILGKQTGCVPVLCNVQYKKASHVGRAREANVALHSSRYTEKTDKISELHSTGGDPALGQINAGKSEM